MAHRPIAVKQRRRVIKALRRTPPAHIDLVQWLLDRRHASTRREAREIILAGRVKSDSHVLGVLRDQEVVTHDALGRPKVERRDVVKPYAPASVRGRIIVSGA